MCHMLLDCRLMQGRCARCWNWHLGNYIVDQVPWDVAFVEQQHHLLCFPWRRKLTKEEVILMVQIWGKRYLIDSFILANKQIIWLSWLTLIARKSHSIFREEVSICHRWNFTFFGLYIWVHLRLQMCSTINFLVLMQLGKSYFNAQFSVCLIFKGKNSTKLLILNLTSKEIRVSYTRDCFFVLDCFVLKILN